MLRASKVSFKQRWKVLYYYRERLIQVLPTLLYQEKWDSRLSEVGNVTSQIPLVDRKQNLSSSTGDKKTYITNAMFYRKRSNPEVISLP